MQVHMFDDNVADWNDAWKPESRNPLQTLCHKKKSEQQESHAELLPFILRVWNITVSVKKKKKN